MAESSSGLLAELTREDVSVFQPRRQRWEEAGRDLVAAAWTRAVPDTRDWDGANRFYLDKYLFLTKPTVLRRLASLMSSLVDGEVERLAGREQGPLSLVAALALETGLPFVVLRGGTSGRRVEGELNPEERVLIVEDVISSGTTASAAASQVASAGAVVSAVLAVVDREEGATALLRQESIPLRSLFSVRDLPLPSVDVATSDRGAE